MNESITEEFNANVTTKIQMPSNNNAATAADSHDAEVDLQLHELYLLTLEEMIEAQKRRFRAQAEALEERLRERDRRRRALRLPTARERRSNVSRPHLTDSHHGVTPLLTLASVLRSILLPRGRSHLEPQDDT